MKYKGMLLADIHFGAGDPKKLYSELKEGILKTVKVLKDELKFIAILGDYFERKLALNSDASRLGLRFMHELISICEEFDIKLRVIRGTITHDLNQLDNFKHLELDATNFRVINNAEYEELLPDLHVLWIPEEYPEDWKNSYKHFFDDLEEGQKYDLILGHGTMEFEAFKGQISESERPIKSAPVFSEKEFIELANYTFFGHIHRASNYRQRVFYCGSFSRTAFGEEEPKGYYTFDYDTDTCKGIVEFIENESAPIYNTYHIDDIKSECDNDDALVIDSIKTLRKECFRLRILNEDDVSSLVLKEHFSEVDGISIKTKKPSGPTRERSDEYDLVFADGHELIPTIRRYIQMKHHRTYNDDVISDCITPANNDMEDE
jgi:hypothetical protein